MHQQEFALALQQLFIVRLEGSLPHVLGKLVLDEARTGDQHALDHVQSHVPQYRLHHRVEKLLQALRIKQSESAVIS